jgi:catechol 2,3-dioxygenase-like lactoylglutathione lyase family enzyme
MPVLGVSHMALAVTDMEAAFGFYRDVLGLRIDADWTQELTIERSGEVTGGRAIRRRTAWLRWDPLGEHTAALTLDQMLSPEPADRRAEAFDLGIHHLAFWVDDIDAVIERARAGGFAVIKPHVATTENYGEPAGGQIRSVFLRDPDGNLVQCDMRP